MGILREIMGILQNFTVGKLWVLNYGFFSQNNLVFWTNYGYFTVNYGYFTDYVELRVNMIKLVKNQTKSNIGFFRDECSPQRIQV